MNRSSIFHILTNLTGYEPIPASVGYGAIFDGLSALPAMLASCANGVSVINIDNSQTGAYYE